ncbi:LacI family DNA-binding transcriptional regulator [Kiloniella sp. b19]|uniref:LacI family DNA-binding transcriptional regulator n=1 Tax=Kiloniella sp. GXU_MW_B19 TaxID=3141326 RepID=UPI0031D8B1FA
MSKVTIKDVAREAGVSAAAVSRVFSKNASVSETMQKKVYEAADKLGYRPNALARALTQTNINLVALITGTLRTTFEAHLRDRLAQKLSEEGLQLLLIPKPQDGKIDDALMTALDYQVCATIVAQGSMRPETLERYARHQVPLIVSGSRAKAVNLDSIAADSSTVRTATEFLIRSGCKSIGYLGTEHRPPSDSERQAACEKALEAAGLTLLGRIGYNTAHPDCPDHILTGLGKLRSAGMDGLICANDTLAYMALTAARKLHIRVPDELSVVGFDNSRSLGHAPDVLSTIHYPLEETANWIVQRILDRRKTPDLPGEHREVSTRLILRATTRPIEDPTELN